MGMNRETQAAIPPREMAPHDEKVRNVELLISGLLRVGVVTSLAVVILGTVLSFVHHPEYLSSKTELARLTRPGAAFPHSLANVWDGVRHAQGQAVVVAGLLLLIATPVMRVAVSVLAFVYEKDRVFVVITTIVLAFLLLSFVLGKAGG
jgi:uncharacterized membrane protein